MSRQTPIGHRLRRHRKDRGLTQMALADAVGISPSYLNLIEHNRRAIGGSLLVRLAEALELEPGSLSGSEEGRLLSDLGEMTADPVFEEAPLDTQEFSSAVANTPAMVKALMTLYRAYRSSLDEVDILSERLSHDPFLADASHSVLTRITAIRTVAEIFHSYDDLPSEKRTHFNQTLIRESERLAESATEIFNFLERGAAGRRAVNPAEEVDDLLYDHDNYFPELETRAGELQHSVDPEGGVFLTDLILHLEARHDVRVERLSSGNLPARGYRWDPQERVLQLSRALPITSSRFLAARLICRLEAGDEIEALVRSARLTTDIARERAREALVSYAAAALLFPYDAFREAALELRHDIEMLQQRFAASWEQVCHRLTTLRHPGREGLPFHFLRTDIAGNISKRFSASGLQLPRYSGACPRWAVHEAYLTPDRLVTQYVRLPDNTTYLFVARAVRRGGGGYWAPQAVHSVMIGCDTAFAKDIVYADGLPLDNPEAAVPVGVGCRQCPREDCLQRAYDQAEPGLEVGAT